MSESAAKRAKVDDEPEAIPAFPGDAGLVGFAAGKVLAFGGGGAQATVLGELGGKAALLKLSTAPELATPAALLEALPVFSTALTNHSGAEYSFYDATLPSGAQYSIEAIWPASDRQIQRAIPSASVVIEETPAMYKAVTEAEHAAAALKIGWIDSVCSLESERDRNLLACDAPLGGYVVNVDTKWKTHPPLAEGAEARQGWGGNQEWSKDLYLLAISKNAALRSIRDLRGPDAVALCESMRDSLRACALQVYGVGADKLRIFFHYQPQFMRLHAHCTRCEHVNPGCEAERAHLLTSVADNLKLRPGYYADDATLTYRLRDGEPLHKALLAKCPEALVGAGGAGGSAAAAN